MSEKHEINVRSSRQQGLVEFLEEHEYIVAEIADNIWQVNAIGGPSIYLAQEGQSLYFQLSIGTLGKLAEDAQLLYQLLDLNSEITPASLAIDSQAQPAELCLVERRELSSLDSNEVLSVLESLNLASIRTQKILQDKIDK